MLLSSEVTRTTEGKMKSFAACRTDTVHSCVIDCPLTLGEDESDRLLWEGSPPVISSVPSLFRICDCVTSKKVRIE